jgi:hypothetical protein
MVRQTRGGKGGDSTSVECLFSEEGRAFNVGRASVLGGEKRRGGEGRGEGGRGGNFEVGRVSVLNNPPASA